jgi:hypothetical protein
MTIVVDDDASVVTCEMSPEEFEKGEAALPDPDPRQGRRPPTWADRRQQQKRYIAALVVVIVCGIALIAALFAFIRSKNCQTLCWNCRQAEFGSVVDYLTVNEISDIQDLVTPGTPQNRAAQWLAETDGANLPIPINSGDYIDGYRYIFRYVMAVNYYALDGPNWTMQLNFMSPYDVCRWNLRPYYGIFCERNTIPRKLHLGTFRPLKCGSDSNRSTNLHNRLSSFFCCAPRTKQFGG